MDGLGLTEINKKIAHIEYDELNPLKQEVNDLKVQLAENNVLTKQAIETNSKLTDTMQIVKDSMVELATSMKASNKVSEELADNVKTLNTKVGNLDDKMESKFNDVDARINSVNDKSKIDLMCWIKQNFVGLAVIVGGLVYFVVKLL